MAPTTKSYAQIAAGAALLVACAVMFYRGASTNWSELVANWQQLCVALGIGGLGVWQAGYGAVALRKAPPPVTTASEPTDVALEAELAVWTRAGVLAKRRKNEAALQAAAAGITATLKG